MDSLFYESNEFMNQRLNNGNPLPKEEDKLKAIFKAFKHKNLIDFFNNIEKNISYEIEK